MPNNCFHIFLASQRIFVWNFDCHEKIPVYQAINWSCFACSSILMTKRWSCNKFFYLERMPANPANQLFFKNTASWQKKLSKNCRKLFRFERVLDNLDQEGLMISGAGNPSLLKTVHHPAIPYYAIPAIPLSRIVQHCNTFNSIHSVLSTYVQSLRRFHRR